MQAPWEENCPRPVEPEPEHKERIEARLESPIADDWRRHFGMLLARYLRYLPENIRQGIRDFLTRILMESPHTTLRKAEQRLREREKSQTI